MRIRNCAALRPAAEPAERNSGLRTRTCRTLPAPLVASLLAGIPDFVFFRRPWIHGGNVARESGGRVGRDSCFVSLDSGSHARPILARRSPGEKDFHPAPSFLDDDGLCGVFGFASMAERKVTPLGQNNDWPEKLEIRDSVPVPWRRFSRIFPQASTRESYRPQFLHKREMFLCCGARQSARKCVQRIREISKACREMMCGDAGGSWRFSRVNRRGKSKRA